MHNIVLGVDGGNRAHVNFPVYLNTKGVISQFSIQLRGVTGEVLAQRFDKSDVLIGFGI